MEIESSENSMIYIDDVFYGIGKVSTRLLSPGQHRVDAKQAGWEITGRTVIVGPSEIEKVMLESTEKSGGSVVIQTYPQGADIYIDSEWAGRTPKRLELKSYPAALRISLDGWEDRQFFIDRYSDDFIELNLRPAKADRNDWIDEKRTRFYGSLGSFILSIPLTAMLYGGIEQTAQAYNSEYAENGTDNYDELLRLQNINRGLYAGYLGSIGLNFIMFFDTIIKAVDYIGSVDYASK